jgi:hypothetical protein
VSQIEVLEKRDLLSVVSLPIAGTSGTFAGAYLGPQPTAAGLALINSLPDTPVRSTALTDYQRDGMITRNDMIDIFASGSGGYANLTADEINSLDELVANGPTLAMPDYVENLASKCFNGGIFYDGGGLTGAQILGQNVSNYFLGQAHPDLTSIGGTYNQVNLPLWNGSPSYHDVAGPWNNDPTWNNGYDQAGSWNNDPMMAGLAELAYRNPGDIQRMFIDNGDGTYTVRFYNNGSPDYVTVDNYLPYQPQTYLWPALIEKAYVQENAAASSYPGGSYAELSNLDPIWALSAIDGPAGSFGRPNISGDLNPLAIAQAWSQGDFVILHQNFTTGGLVWVAVDGEFTTQIDPPTDWALVGVDYAGGLFKLAHAGNLYGVNYSDLGADFNSWVDARPTAPALSAMSATPISMSPTTPAGPVMAASLVSLPVVGTGTLAGAFLGPQPTAEGLAFLNGLPDTPVRSAALTDYQRDGYISRNDMIDIFASGSSGYTNLTADEINSLGTLVYNGPSTLAMPDYVQDLAYKAFNGIGVGGLTGAQVLFQNVNNYFLGQARPDTTGSYYDTQVLTTGSTQGLVQQSATYVPVQLPLWNGSPHSQDVASALVHGEANVDDAWLMSGLAELASRNPGDIQRMFIDNGDGTYTVRLYNGGTPDYVTVDNSLPFLSYPDARVPVGARSDTVLWAALIEKAYVQETGGTYQQALHAAGADPTWALSAIDGPVGWFGQANFSPTINALAIANDWSHGDFVVLRGTPLPVDNGIWAVAQANSYYALVGVDYANGLFTFSDNHGTLYQMDTSYLQANFDGWFQASAQVPPPSVTPLSILGIFRPAAASTLAVTPHLVIAGGNTAGVAHIVTVAALDANGTVVTGYSGTVHFSSSDVLAGLPSDYTFQPSDNGQHTFSVTLYKAGMQSITATDTSNSTISGSAAIKIGPAAASSFVLSAPVSTTAGQPVSVAITAYDAFGNVATGYTGTVHFSSSDALAGLPSDYTFQPSDNGQHTFSVTLDRAGSQSVTATDASNNTITGSAAVSVSPAAATNFSISAPSATIAGNAVTVTVTALDAYGNVASGYTGTVHFNSSDALAGLPSDYTFQPSDNGQHTFTVTLDRAGSQSIQVTDASNSSISGGAGVCVSPAAATSFSISAPSAAIAGNAVTVTVTALDAYGNVATGYSGTIHFTSSVAKGILPANATLSNGTASFSVAFKTLGLKSLTVTDIGNPSLTGAQSGIQVSGPASVFHLSGFPATTTAGATLTLTLTAKDAFGNIVRAYAGTVHFTSNDPQALLPANYTFTAADAGVSTFSVTLKTVGSRSVTVTDTANASLTRIHSGITVTPAAASQLLITGLASVAQAIAQAFTVRVVDAYGNTITGYRGTVHFNSSDLQAMLPADYKFSATDAGKHTFHVTFKTPGTQWLQVADKASSALTGQDLGIVVV